MSESGEPRSHGRFKQRRADWTFVLHHSDFVISAHWRLFVLIFAKGRIRPMADMIGSISSTRGTADCFQIADAAVGKNDQVPVPVDVCRFDKPWVARAFMWAHGFVVECHRVVIDADVLRLRVIWISHAVLNRGADPRLLRWTKWRERTNPAPGIILETVAASLSH